MENEKRSTGRSAAGLLIIVIAVVALIAAVAWALTQPGFLEEVLNILAIVMVAVVVIAVVAYVAYAVLGVAYYASKGETVQHGVDHSLDEIRGVEGRTLDDDGNDLDGKDRGPCRGDAPAQPPPRGTEPSTMFFNGVRR